MTSKRQQDYHNLTNQALENPDLKKFLDIFQYAQDYYNQAVANFEIVTITSSTSTNFQEGTQNASLGRNNTGNPSTK